ncbi:hypothetical protein ACK8HX_16360 [Oryzobacter sp. R7]|uniref:hypothetical protein n=1 Tax=Oryzobacter faecalis TaxID=3388656 RepID=UPI00398D21DE
MRLEWTGLRRPPVPEDVAAAIAPEGGEKLLAWAGEESTGGTVVAGRHRLHAVAPGPDGHVLALSRPWHLVDSGTWDGDTSTLTVTWVDGERPARFVLPEPGTLPETLRERVQASVVYAEAVELGGRRTARVVVRKDLATGRLLSQAILPKGVRSSDEGVAERVRAGLARVREQVGLA